MRVSIGVSIRGVTRVALWVSSLNQGPVHSRVLLIRTRTILGA